MSSTPETYIDHELFYNNYCWKRPPATGLLFSNRDRLWAWCLGGLTGRDGGGERRGEEGNNPTVDMKHRIWIIRHRGRGLYHGTYKYSPRGIYKQLSHFTYLLLRSMTLLITHTHKNKNSSQGSWIMTHLSWPLYTSLIVVRITVILLFFTIKHCIYLPITLSNSPRRKARPILNLSSLFFSQDPIPWLFIDLPFPSIIPYHSLNL